MNVITLNDRKNTTFDVNDIRFIQFNEVTKLSIALDHVREPLLIEYEDIYKAREDYANLLNAYKEYHTDRVIVNKKELIAND